MSSFSTPAAHDDEADDDVTVIRACMTCLSDDAARLHRANPEDEVADNMLRAEGIIGDMSALLLDCRTVLTAGIYVPNLVEHINDLLYRT